MDRSTETGNPVRLQTIEPGTPCVSTKASQAIDSTGVTDVGFRDDDKTDGGRSWLDFASNFGPLETTIHAARSDAKLRVRAEIADVSNLDPGESIWGKESRKRMFEMGNRMWHTDSSFRRLPAKASLLYARSIPPVGGQTEFADMRAAAACTIS